VFYNVTFDDCIFECVACNCSGIFKAHMDYFS
jgi:hypothetical protein